MDKDKKEPFSAPRWSDIPVPTVTGHVTFSEEERNESRKKLEELIERDKKWMKEQENKK